MMNNDEERGKAMFSLALIVSFSAGMKTPGEFYGFDLKLFCQRPDSTKSS